MVGLVINAMALVFDRHFFHAYYYFYLAGILEYIHSFARFAQVGQEAIRLFHGFSVFRKPIALKWATIAGVERRDLDKKGFATAGGGRGGVRFDYKQTIVGIQFNAILAPQIRKIFRKKKHPLFARQIEVSPEGDRLLLLEPPGEGFDALLTAIADHGSVAGFDVRDKASPADQFAAKAAFKWHHFIIATGLALYLVWGLSNVLK